MAAYLSRVVGAVAAFAVIFLSGHRLSRAGMPYSTLLLTVHKLMGMAAAVALVVTMVRANRATTLGTGELVAGVVASALYLGLIATGGLLSTEKPMPALVSRVHQVAPYLALIATAITAYLLLGHTG